MNATVIQSVLGWMTTHQEEKIVVMNGVSVPQMVTWQLIIVMRDRDSVNHWEAVLQTVKILANNF